MNKNIITDKRTHIVAMLLVVLLSWSCARQIEMIPTNKRPLPEGEATRIDQKNNTTRYELKISYLISPDKLDAQAKYYAVWATENGTSEKVAQWQGAVSSTKRLTVETILNNPKFFVTAEQDQNVETPTGPFAIKEITVKQAVPVSP